MVFHHNVHTAHKAKPNVSLTMALDYSKWDHIGSDDSDNDSNGGNAEELIKSFAPKIGIQDDEDDDNPSIYVPHYEEKELGDGWCQVGHVQIHPSERRKGDDNTIKGLDYRMSYPPVVLTKDPKTYRPDPSLFPDGLVRNWGIPSNSIVDEEAVQDDPEMMSRMLMLKSNRHWYTPYKSGTGFADCDPLRQFINALWKARQERIDSSQEVKELRSKVFTLKITLEGCEEDVSRTLQVPGGISLARFHDQVLIPTMGYSRGYHGYMFEDAKDGAVLGPKENSAYIDMMHVALQYHHFRDDRKYPLAGLLQKVGDVVLYTYDLGDNWRHKIELLEVLTPDDSLDARIISGHGGCPPEDSIGLDGSGNEGHIALLQAYKKNPRKPRVKEMIRKVEKTATNYTKPWAGGPPLKFKPLQFDIHRHRRDLALMIAGPAVLNKGLCGQGVTESFEGCPGCSDRLKAMHYRCSKCGARYYCSRDCQVTDWPKHKKDCKACAKKRNNQPKKEDRV